MLHIGITPFKYTYTDSESLLYQLATYWNQPALSIDLE